MSSTPSDPRPGQGSTDPDRSRDVKIVLIPETALPELSGEAGSGSEPQVDLTSEGSAEEVQAAQRGRVVAQWLQSLERRSAPFGLDGRVVAAMNGGFRQDRAVAALAALRPEATPVELESMVAARVLRNEPQARQTAPDQLDALVERRVAEPEATLVEGMAKRLDPIQAPSELEGRVEGELQVGDEPGVGSSAPLSTYRGLAAGLALAACALFMLFPNGRDQASSTAGPGVVPPAVEIAAAPVQSGDIVSSRSGISFRVVRVTEENMTAADRAVIGALGLPVSEEG